MERTRRTNREHNPVRDMRDGDGYRVHIDDGDMGGGGRVWGAPTVEYNRVIQNTKGYDYNDFSDFYNNDFVHVKRQNIFHYCLLTHILTLNGVNEGGVANNPLIGQFVNGHFGIATIDKNSNDEKAATFMHELGHTIGLYKDKFNGIDNLATNPGDAQSYNEYCHSNYISSMNYHYEKIGFVDYSDGSHPALNEVADNRDYNGDSIIDTIVYDYNDWGNLDIGITLHEMIL